MKKKIIFLFLILFIIIVSSVNSQKLNFNVIDIKVYGQNDFIVTSEQLPNIGDEIEYEGVSYIISELFYGLSGYYEYCNLIDFNNKMYLMKMLEPNSMDALFEIYCYESLTFDPWALLNDDNIYLNNPKVIDFYLNRDYNQYCINYYYYISCKELYHLRTHNIESNEINEVNSKSLTSLLYGIDLYLYSPYYYESTQNTIYSTFTKSNFKNGFYYSNLKNNFGFNQYGSCGYIALQMILSYYDSLYDDSIIPEQYDLNSQQSHYLIEDFTESPGSKEDFHSYLIDIFLEDEQIENKEFGLQYSQMSDLFNTYKNSTNNTILNEYTINYQCIDYNTDLSTIEEEIINKLDQGNPVILMTNAWELYQYTYHNSNNDYIVINKNEKWYGYGHAVVVYGYYIINDEVYLRTNMGWKGENYYDVLIKTLGLTGYFSLDNNDNSLYYKEVSNYYYLENNLVQEITFSQISNLVDTNLNQNAHYFKFHNDTVSYKNSELYKIYVDTYSSYNLFINGDLIDNYNMVSSTKKEYIYYLDDGTYFNIVIIASSDNNLSGMINVDSGERLLTFGTANLIYYVYNASTGEYITERLSVLFFNPVIDSQNKSIHFDQIRIQCELVEGQIGYDVTDFDVIFICGEEYDSISNGYCLYVFHEYSLEYSYMPDVNGFVGIIEDIDIQFSDEQFEDVTYDELNYIF